MSNAFLPADILLPGSCDMSRWAVIACDQYTSEPDYWQRVRDFVADAPSTLRMILPEADLAHTDGAAIAQIHAEMERHLDSGLLHSYPNSYVYVERTLRNGTIRQGVVGMIDLEQYDYDPASHPKISATEATVLERIPPRVQIRADAPIEFSHVILLCDDPGFSMIEPIAQKKSRMRKLYDFTLMEDGGHIAAWLLDADAADSFDEAIKAYELCNAYLVGDGNHSLVTAKTIYEDIKKTSEDAAQHPARYALVELENIHNPALRFEPIHRVVTNTDPQKLLRDLEAVCPENGTYVDWVAGTQKGRVCLRVNEKGLVVAVLQAFLDEWLSKNPGTIDYVHDASAVEALSKQKDSIGFLLPALDKSALFPYISNGATLPRKTFSTGHATEKRYYLEGRKIK